VRFTGSAGGFWRGTGLGPAIEIRIQAWAAQRWGREFEVTLTGSGDSIAEQRSF
jgi:hypothetical protein